MHLAFSVAISSFIFLEYIRYFRVWPLGEVLHSYLVTFVDKRDSGPAILSHLYLLFGCALPVWLNRIPNRDFIAGLSGMITLGIGDSMVRIAFFINTLSKEWK
jgi:dolichol kinase